MQINSADKTVQAEGQVQAVQDPNFNQVWVLLNSKPAATRFRVPAGEVSWSRLKSALLIYGAAVFSGLSDSST